MKRLLWLIATTLTLALAALLGQARPAVAQAPKTGNETVTAQVDLRVPSGEHVTGMIVNERVLGSDVQSTWTFTGMVSGVPVTISGTAVERWLGDNHQAIEVTRITAYSYGAQKPRQNADGSLAIPTPLLQNLVVEHQGNGVFIARGVPLAIGQIARNGASIPFVPHILPPGSGNIGYLVTNAGQGPTEVAALPNTTDGAVLLPPTLPGALPAGAALALLGLGAIWYGRHRRAAR